MQFPADIRGPNLETEVGNVGKKLPKITIFLMENGGSVLRFLLKMARRLFTMSTVMVREKILQSHCLMANI
jgi:hypothetical protein